MAQRPGAVRGVNFNLKKTSAALPSASGPQGVFRPPPTKSATLAPPIDLTDETDAPDKSSKKIGSNKRAWMYDIPSPKSSAPLRGVAQESNKRRKIYEVEGNEEPNQGAEDDMEPPNSPLPTQAPPDTPGMDVNASIDISVVEDDGIPPSASQSDGIQLSESPSQAISNAQLPGRIFWAASSTTVSVLRPGGGIQDLTTKLHSESSNGGDQPNPLFSEWFAPISSSSAVSDPDSGQSREGIHSDGPAAAHPSRLLGILERLSSASSKPTQIDQLPSAHPGIINQSVLHAPKESPQPLMNFATAPNQHHSMLRSTPSVQASQTSHFAAARPPVNAGIDRRAVPLQLNPSGVVKKEPAPAPVDAIRVSPLVPDVAALLADIPSDAFSDFNFSPPRPAQLHSNPAPLVSEGKYRRLQVLEKLKRPQDNKSVWRCFDEYDLNFPEWEVEVFDPWRQSDVAVGDYINVVGKSEAISGDGPETRRFVVDDDKNLLVLQPDLLLTSTMITTVCARQAILQRICKPFDNSRPYEALRGDIIHRVIQEALKEGKRLSKEEMLPLLRQEIKLHSEELRCFKKTPLEVEKDIASSALMAIQRVGESYFGPKFPTNATDINFNGYKFKVRIQKCLEVEEKIESLVYGLKGSIDVSAEAVVHGNGLEMRTVELPLEIKSTYRPTHQRQVMAYSLLMADRYDRDIKGALVMGVGKDSTANMLHGVTIDRPGIVDLMRSRNQLASHMASGNHPPPAVGLSECAKCRVRDQCALLYKADQLLSPRPYLPPADDKKLIDSLEARSAALTPAYADFLQRWISLINLEERHALKERRSVWSMPPEERERRGLGFHNLRVEHIGVENQHLYEFKRLQSGSSATAGTPNAPLFDSSIHENDEIVVSSGRHIALGRGRVQKATPRSLVVLLKEKLISPMNTADDPTSQRFYGMHKPDRSFQSPLKPKIKSSYAPIAGSRQAIQDIEDLGSQAVIDRSEVKDQIWCVDKDEFHFTHATARSNVLFMFLYNNSAAARLRRLIVDLEPPKFKKSPTPNTSFASGEVPLQDPLNNTDKASLNEDQKRVINAVLEAQDYALILGMPGTGKTSTVAHLISELTKKRKSILITAFTHSAVDNLLLKIKALGIRFCRLGEGDRVHEEIRPHVYSTKGDGSNHPSQFDVVATTCWGIEKLMLDKRTFDYCLVDEASQLTLPACIGPLRFAERFVLIGDLYQLPPLVRNRDAKSDGLAESLFKKLSEAHPSSVFELRKQYRMNSDIMGLSNRIIYGGKLRCGNEEVQHASLQIPGGLQSIPQPLSRMQQHWISDLLDPTARVRFVDTDDLPAPEDVSGSTDGASDATIRNEVEALVVSLIVKASLECGILPQHIGVIAHLRSQIRAISSRFGAQSTSVEINTVDKYQGRDKELIIVSLVRSNPHGSIGTLMQDFRRLNVALTRSKHKLLIIGSRSTFQSHHLFCELLEYLAQRRWVYRLPKAAHTFYDHKIS